MTADEILEELDIYSVDFKEKLNNFVKEKIYEVVKNSLRDDIIDIVADCELSVSADNVSGLSDFIADHTSESVDADSVDGLEDKIKKIIRDDITFEVSVGF